MLYEILRHIGVSPSGKAPGFGPGIPRFESLHPRILNNFIKIIYLGHPNKFNNIRINIVTNCGAAMEKINYTLTLEDCNNYVKSQYKIPRLKKAINKAHLKTSLGYAVFLIIVAIVTFSFIIYNVSINNHLSLFSVLKNNDLIPFLTKFFINSFVLIILFTFILLMALHIRTYYFGAQYAYKMLSGIDLNYEISVSEENITRTNKNGINILIWKTIKDIYDTTYNYLIFVSDLQAIIIPKRCFKNKEQSKEFYNKIKKYYDDAQKG